MAMIVNTPPPVFIHFHSGKVFFNSNKGASVDV